MSPQHSPDILPDPSNFNPLNHWRVVLVSPQTSANVGAVARLVSNFGVGELHIVNPRCDVSIDGDAGKLARSIGETILVQMNVVQTIEEALSGTALSFALSMHDMEDRPAEIVGFDPSPFLHHQKQSTNALVFGREDNGLTNEEASMCSYRWAFPLNPEFPSLNLAQAVAIALGSISNCDSLKRCYQSEGKERSPEEPTVADFDEINGLINHLEQVIDCTGFERGVPKEYPIRLLRRLVSRSSINQSELKVLRGLCRRIINAVDRTSG